MARSGATALGRLELPGTDVFEFCGDYWDERERGLDRAGDEAPDAAAGLGLAATAPAGTPADGAEAPPPDIGPAGLTWMSGIALLDPVLAAKGGNGGNGGGGGKPGGGGGGDPTLLSSYTSGGDAATSYNIEVVFKGTWTQALQQAFIDAADYLSTIITADIADVFFRGKVIDDIRIDAKLTAIDGEGGILGQAGPTAYRAADFLPATAVMEFDSADAAFFDGLGLFDDIVLHEMLHSIGFGTMWDLMGLTEGTIAADTLVFVGSNAMTAYGDEFGGSGGVPVETDGGAGTAGGHWDEDTFVNELMTGYIDGTNYVSAMTVAALEDMGYDTLYDPGETAADLPVFGALIA